MVSFKNYLIFESRIKELYHFIAGKLKEIVSKLGFGEKKSIKINMDSLKEHIMLETIDTKSRLGYYSEYVTAYELSVLLNKKGANLTTERSQPAYLKSLMDEKKKELVKIKAPADEIKRMETAGVVMSKSIFNDIILSGYDYNALQFDIELTGVSEKGASKSDLILTVGKMSKKEIVDRINASLKAYKSPRINLSNSTFVSFIKTLFYDGIESKNTEQFIGKFAEDYGSESDLKKLYALQNLIGTKMNKGTSKESARKLAKTTHGEVIEIISKIFKSHYKNNKEEINARMLKVLGFDGQDDFYAAIGKAGKQKAVSSRQSKEMQQMLEDLRNGFELVMERNGKTNNANIFFKSIDGTKIINQANITFTDTGGDKPQGKTNAFVNIGKFAK